MSFDFDGDLFFIKVGNVGFYEEVLLFFVEVYSWKSLRIGALWGGVAFWSFLSKDVFESFEAVPEIIFPGVEESKCFEGVDAFGVAMAGGHGFFFSFFFVIVGEDASAYSEGCDEPEG